MTTCQVLTNSRWFRQIVHSLKWFWKFGPDLSHILHEICPWHWFRHISHRLPCSEQRIQNTAHRFPLGLLSACDLSQWDRPLTFFFKAYDLLVVGSNIFFKLNHLVWKGVRTYFKTSPVQLIPGVLIHKECLCYFIISGIQKMLSVSLIFVRYYSVPPAKPRSGCKCESIVPSHKQIYLAGVSLLSSYR